MSDDVLEWYNRQLLELEMQQDMLKNSPRGLTRKERRILRDYRNQLRSGESSAYLQASQHSIAKTKSVHALDDEDGETHRDDVGFENQSQPLLAIAQNSSRVDRRKMQLPRKEMSSSSVICIRKPPAGSLSERELRVKPSPHRGSRTARRSLEESAKRLVVYDGTACPGNAGSAARVSFHKLSSKPLHRLAMSFHMAGVGAREALLERQRLREYTFGMKKKYDALVWQVQQHIRESSKLKKHMDVMKSSGRFIEQGNAVATKVRSIKPFSIACLSLQ